MSRAHDTETEQWLLPVFLGVIDDIVMENCIKYEARATTYIYQYHIVYFKMCMILIINLIYTSLYSKFKKLILFGKIK